MLTGALRSFFGGAFYGLFNFTGLLWISKFSSSLFFILEDFSSSEYKFLV